MKLETGGVIKMTKDEALKLALKALDIYDYTGTSEESELVTKAINACKEALATNKESSLVQPAQEPAVYWQGDFSKHIGTATMYEVKQESVFGRKYRNIPLYTRPAQPLDIEILNGLYDMAEERDGDAFDFDHIKFARAIEQAHGIGVNN